MSKEGFEHRQKSGYVSQKPLSDAELADVFEKIIQSLPWLLKCANHFDVTNVGKTYDFLELYSKKEIFLQHGKFEKSNENCLFRIVTEAEHKKLKDANLQFDTKRTEKGIVIRYSSQLKDKIEKTLSPPRGKQSEKADSIKQRR